MFWLISSDLIFQRMFIFIALLDQRSNELCRLHSMTNMIANKQGNNIISWRSCDELSILTSKKIYQREIVTFFYCFSTCRWFSVNFYVCISSVISMCLFGKIKHSSKNQLDIIFCFCRLTNERKETIWQHPNGFFYICRWLYFSHQ